MSTAQKKYIQENYPTSKTLTERISYVLGFITMLIVEFFEAIVIAVFLCVILYLFIITPHKVVGRSMMPNFLDGEYIIANKIVYRIDNPDRGDVIILDRSNQDLIKRVIGLPGETLAVRGGNVYVNGTKLDETEYLSEDVYTSNRDAIQEGDEITLASDEYLVFGDNRPESSDSRTFGVVDREDIKAKAWVVYFPFDRTRVIDDPSY